jgi:ribosomal protein L37AE/L43A
MTVSTLRKSAKQYHEQEHFTIVCAWCNRVRHGREWRTERGQRNGPSVSHGICPECYQRQIERLGSHK